MDEKTILMKLLSIFIMDGMSVMASPIVACLNLLEVNHNIDRQTALDTARNYEDIQVLEEDLLSFIPLDLALIIMVSKTLFLDEYIKSICKRITQDVISKVKEPADDNLLELERTIVPRKRKRRRIRKSN